MNSTPEFSKTTYRVLWQNIYKWGNDEGGRGKVAVNNHRTPQVTVSITTSREEVHRDYENSPLAYTGLYAILKNLEAKNGIKVSAHPFRRGGARHHASQGRNAREGLEQGGWRSWEMYWRYTRGVSLDWFKKKSWGDENEDALFH